MKHRKDCIKELCICDLYKLKKRKKIVSSND